MLERLSIRAKISLFSIVTLALTFIVGIAGVFGTLYINNKYVYMNETADVRLVSSYDIQENFDDLKENMNMMMLVAALGTSDGSSANIDNFYKNISTSLSNIDEIADTYRNNLNGDNTVTQENKDRLNNDIDIVTTVIDGEYKGFIDAMYTASKSGMTNLDTSAFEAVTKKNTEIGNVIDDMVQAAVDKKNVMIDSCQGVATGMWIFVLVFLLLILAVNIVVGNIISKKIVNPLKSIMNVFEKVANGDFNVNIRSNGRDECSRLLNDFSVVVDNVSNIIDDIEEAVAKFEKGDIKIELNADKYNGEYKKLVSAVSDMMDGFTKQNESIVNTIHAYGKGDFGVVCPRFPGGKAVVHESLDSLKDNLEKTAISLRDIIDDISNGKFDVRLDSSEFEGAWARIIENLNRLVKSVEAPLKDTISMLNYMASADFSKQLNESNYNGEFKIAAKTANKCSSTISGYVNEISQILESVARQDLSVDVSDNFVGDFREIKDSLETLIQNFNVLVKDIAASSEQVALGSKSIADSSLNLAQGATEQANAVEELNATVRDIAQKSSENAEKSTLASKLAVEAQGDADIANKEMKDMLVAMDEISEASNNISNIIKAIDDIAFQTNILALNAAVEAARAGEHGKGFAVVADEVRSLASRSQQSARETSELITTSLEKVEQGTSIANRTAEALKSIINQIIKISEIFAEVAEASEKQNVAMNEVNVGISQISDVVANNTATSEESAAASEELASQSALFREVMLKFKLK